MKGCHKRGLSLTQALLATLLVAAAPLLAEQRDPEAWVRFLEGADRVARLQVARVIEMLEIEPGMRVADLGAGSGLFTRPIARAVGPTGVAYAIEIDEGLLAIIERLAREQGIENLRTVLASPDDSNVPEPVDLILICDTLHHIANQGSYLKNLRGYVRPGGRIAVVDFNEGWPEGHERMAYSVEQLDGWMRAAGFEQVAAHDFLDQDFFVVYR